MRSSVMAFGLLFAAPATGLCQATISGYVTRGTSPADFDVNGQHIYPGPNATFQTVTKGVSSERYPSTPAREVTLYVGEPVDVYGEVTSKKAHTVSANRILIYPRELHSVSGTGVIDAILPLPAAAASTDRLIRADGYPILISADTKLAFNKPLSAPSDINVNVWAAFHGKQRPDGVVLAEDISFTKNTVTHGEDNLRERNEYDPTAVAADKKQSALSKGFRGIDPRQIPPYKDEAMQNRVSAIGAKLVPKYQADFPYTEVTRIDFRFQVIDSTKWRDALTLPNGIILVPRQVVERMQNDSQLATVLADNIACALEKQPLAGHNEGTDMGAANLAGAVAGFFIPGLGLATQLATGTTAVKLLQLHEEQSGRVSLSLLHDAGFDIEQAPIAWWLLAPKKPKDLEDIPLPRRAAYLYAILGQTWQSPASTPPAAAPSAPQQTTARTPAQTPGKANTSPPSPAPLSDAETPLPASSAPHPPPRESSPGTAAAPPSPPHASTTSHASHYPSAPARRTAQTAAPRPPESTPSDARSRS